MPLDSICISGLQKELSGRILGGRIDKVQQPERDMILLSLRAERENLKLLLAAGTGNARIHVTGASFENPAEPPMFCMLLRKHLVGARILEIRQPDWERMLILELDTRNELGVSARKQLVVEMIGRSANIILVGEDGRIIDCLRRTDFAGDALRRMQPGMIYRLPPKQEKALFFTASSEERREMLAGVDRDTPIDKRLMDRFSGLSPLICREMAARCGGDWDLLPLQLDALADTVAAGELSPTLLSRNGKPADYSFLPLRQYGPEAENESFASFSALLDAFYTRRDKQEQQRRRAHDLARSVKTARDRMARKLQNQYEEYKRTDTRDQVLRKAELVTANLYRIRRGDRELRCQDYYEPDCPEITIPLDGLKTPQQNAAAMFKEYRKLKGAREHLSVLIGENEQQLDYLNSVLRLLEQAESEKDLSDLRRELIQTGILRPGKSAKADRSKPQAPLRFISEEGFEILVGRSNVQNDELTTKLALRSDLWLHVQKIHGSHVILRCDGEQPGEQSILQAAAIAAYYSQAREGGKVPVDYTQIRYVKKPSGSLPGKVIYTNYRSVVVQADEALVQRLRK